MKIQQHFCIGQLRNLLNIANVTVSDVLGGLSPLSVCQSAVTNRRGVQQTMEQGRHSPGKPETDALPSCMEGFGDWYLRPAMICEGVNGFPRHRISKALRGSFYSLISLLPPLPTFWSSYDGIIMMSAYSGQFTLLVGSRFILIFINIMAGK